MVDDWERHYYPYTGVRVGTYLVVAYPFIALGAALLAYHAGSVPRRFVLQVGAFCALATLANAFLVPWLRRETRRRARSMEKRFPLDLERAEERLDGWLTGEGYRFKRFKQVWTIRSPRGVTAMEVRVEPHGPGWTRFQVTPLDEGTDLEGVLEALDGAMAGG